MDITAQRALKGEAIETKSEGPAACWQSKKESRYKAEQKRPGPFLACHRSPAPCRPSKVPDAFPAQGLCTNRSLCLQLPPLAILKASSTSLRTKLKHPLQRGLSHCPSRGSLLLLPALTVLVSLCAMPGRPRSVGAVRLVHCCCILSLCCRADER